ERCILKEAYSSGRAMDNLTTLCDEYGERFSGSDENREAAEYILSLYEEYGFDNPHLEQFSFPFYDMKPLPDAEMFLGRQV
ncbi:hypothetical protein MUP51_11190, partial [Candidatus Bathyarchaeota archaeon]|nr:hypothetical protein [Candidatus Bathyarchaeota archaeon]